MELKNASCLITGGTKGIGAAAAVELAKNGANVAIVGRHDDAEAKSVKKAVESLGRRCLILTGDMGKGEDCRRVVRECNAGLGGVDVVVHSAGGPVNGSLMEIDFPTWQRAFDVHVHAVFHLCQEALPLMKPKKRGAVILISSTAGKLAIPTNIAYQAVKGAIPHITRALARECAVDNIRVNCVAPGVIRTAFHKDMPEAVKKNNLENRIPLKREGTIEQVASIIRELITNDYITGDTVTIDGGLTMRIA